MYAVIGTAPTIDTSVGVGPFRSMERAMSASDELESLGYNTEIVPLSRISEVETVKTWEE